MKAVVRVVGVVAIVATAVFVAALFLNEPDAGEPSGDLPASVDDPGPSDPLELGADVYGRRCAGCHGGDGQGGVGPQLGGGAVEAAYPDPADQAEVIREGRNGMPGFGNLSDAEIDAVVVYTRQLPG